MKQLLQNLKTGATAIVDVPPPALRPGGVPVQNRASLVSAGTEGTTVPLAQNSLVAIRWPVGRSLAVRAGMASKI